MAAAVNVTMLVLGRVLLGLGVGASVQCGPLFLSELAQCHLRGAGPSMCSSGKMLPRWH
jgi:MFS family permease